MIAGRDLGVRNLGSSRGYRTWVPGKFGTCILWGLGSPESKNGVSKFWGPPKGEVIKK
jgi:hypothetical protein